MNKFDKTWDHHFALFCKYLASHHKLPVPAETYRGFNIGTWVTNQLRAGRAGRLPESRAQLLAKACHLDDSTLERFDRQEWNTCILMASWKENLRPGDIAIDSVFSGDELLSCLRRGIYSCRDYIDTMESLCTEHDKYSYISIFSYPAAPDLFCRENAESVFHTQFPRLDFTCFNLYIPVYTTSNSNLFKEDELEELGHRPSLYEAATAMNAYSRFGSRDEMRQAYAELIETLPPKQRTVIQARHFQQQTYRAIGDSLGLTVERIRQIHMSALRKLRHPARGRRIAPLHPSDAAAERAREEKIAAREKALEEYIEATQKDLDVNLAASQIPITDLEFSARAYHCLGRRPDIKTLGDLASLTRSELLSIRNLGRRCADEIQARLQEYGLDLTPEPEVVPIPKHPSLDEQLATAQSQKKPTSGDGFGGDFDQRQREIPNPPKDDTTERIPLAQQIAAARAKNAGSGPGGPGGPGDSKLGLGRSELSSEDHSTTYVRKRKPDEPTFYPDR